MTKIVNTSDPSKQNLTFNLKLNEDGSWPTDKIQIMLLADIRRELKKLNTLLHCPSFQAIPGILRRIDRRLAKHAPLKK